MSTICTQEDKGQFIELDIYAGSKISEACVEAAELAQRLGKDVKFVFNDTAVLVHPRDSTPDLEAKWHTDYEANAKRYRESDEYKAAEAKRLDELAQKRAARMTEAATTEAELRVAESKWPYTKEQLIEYITSLTERSHDYGTCVYAMSLAAVAAFNYVSHQLGVTGFQASCADMDFIRRTRNYKGPFMLINGADALYPQYDLESKLSEALREWRPWLKEQAAKNLSENSGHAAEGVVAHWRKLAAYHEPVSGSAQ